MLNRLSQHSNSQLTFAKITDRNEILSLDLDLQVLVELCK